MDLLEATESEIERNVGGVLRKFVRLDSYDRAELLRADLKRRQDERPARKQKLIENLDLAGISGETKFAELEKFDDEFPTKVTDEDWFRIVNDPLCECAIYEASLKKSYTPEEAAEIAKKTTLDIADKAKLVGLPVITRKADDENPPMAPSIPPTFSTPAPTTEMNLKTDAA